MRVRSGRELGGDSQGGFALSYLRDCIEPHRAAAIRNVRTEMHLLETGKHAFPVSVNHGCEGKRLSYVVSPSTAYDDYARDELDRLRRPLLTFPLRSFLRSSGALLRAAAIDRVAQINNWLISTNVYPADWNGDDLEELTAFAVRRWPEHAIGFRSLNPFSNAPLLERMRALGYVRIPSRQVYVFDARSGPGAPFLQRHNVAIDAALLRKTPYRIVTGEELDEREFERLEELYNLLYLDRYCRLNPQFTARWLRCGRDSGWLTLRALRSPQGRIDAVVGWFGTADLLTAPIVGYDTALPQRLGLYRMLTRLSIDEAVRRRTVLNYSSGAAHFKRLRGAVPHIEYSMVYVNHLPRARRVAWRALERGLELIAVPMLRGMKL